MLRIRPLAALILSALLVACGSAGSGPASSLTQGGPDPRTPAAGAATAGATAGPDGTAVATADASALAMASTAVAATQVGLGGTAVAVAPPTPVVGAPPILPAPAYFLDQGQVLRLERDAASSSSLTFEQRPVLELAVPAEAGAIFYLTGDPEGAERTLVALSGAGRRELLSGKLSSLAVSPDGARAFVRLDDPEPGLIIGQDESPAGVWATTPAGGRPGLVLADEPGDDVYDEARPAWTYRPIAVSPDGARVALYAYDADAPPIPGGELVIVGDEGEPVRGPTCCEDPAWSADGAALHAAGGGPGPDVRYGLYRSSAATGAEAAVIEAGAEGPVPLVTAPRQLADGQLYAFVELARGDGFSWEHPFRPALARVEEDGAVTPLAPPTLAPGEVLWSADGGGALVAAPAPAGRLGGRLSWQPSDGRPAAPLPFAGGDLAWAPGGARLADGDCGAFEPLRYQGPAERQASAAVYDLQGRLRHLGLDAGPADGLYGDTTRVAVQVFQRARGLPPTGDVDCATWQAMLARP